MAGEVKCKRTGSEDWVPGHAVHEVAPAPENVSAWHGTQPAVPAMLYVPGVHGLHVEPFGNWPASQLSVVHSAAPYVKIKSVMKNSNPYSLTKRHTCGEAVPGGQGEQRSDPVSRVKVLGGQSVHDVLPASL